MRIISRQRRDELIDALRRGTVPMQSLDLLAVGLERFTTTVDEELEPSRRVVQNSRLFVANTARVRRFFLDGWQSVLGSWASLHLRFRYQRPKHLCTAWKQCTGA